MGKSIRFRLQLCCTPSCSPTVVRGFAGLLYYEVREARLAQVDSELETSRRRPGFGAALFPRHELTGEPPPRPPPKKAGPPIGPEFEPPPMRRDHLLNGLDLPGPPSDRPKDVYFAVWRAGRQPA